jgi:hypothetical protein
MPFIGNPQEVRAEANSPFRVSDLGVTDVYLHEESGQLVLGATSSVVPDGILNCGSFITRDGTDSFNSCIVTGTGTTGVGLGSGAKIGWNSAAGASASGNDTELERVGVGILGMNP